MENNDRIQTIDLDKIIPLTVAEAKRLADLHLALAQEYRKLAGLQPVQTPRQERNPGRLAPVAIDAKGTIKGVPNQR